MYYSLENNTQFRPYSIDQTFLIRRNIPKLDVSLFRVQIHTVKSVKTGLGTLIDFGIDVKVDLDELLTVEDVTIKETKPLTSTLIMHKIQAPFSSLSHEQLLDKSRSHYFLENGRR